MIVIIQPTLGGTPIQFLLNIDEVYMKSSANVEYLGITLDQHLKYKSYIESIAKKVSRATGIPWKLRKFCQQKPLLNFCSYMG